MRGILYKSIAGKQRAESVGEDRRLESSLSSASHRHSYSASRKISRSPLEMTADCHLERSERSFRPE
jgi:hypothetical protein